MPSQILLVDDHTETRESLKKLLAFESDLIVVCSASNGRDGVEQSKVLRSHVIIMEANLPEIGGFEATKLIIKVNPKAYVIIMSV